LAEFFSMLHCNKDGRDAGSRHARTPNPVTFKIYKESRVKSLRRYEGIPSEQVDEPVTYFHTKLDNLTRFSYPLEGWLPIQKTAVKLTLLKCISWLHRPNSNQLPSSRRSGHIHLEVQGIIACHIAISDKSSWFQARDPMRATNLKTLSKRKIASKSRNLSLWRSIAP